MAKMNADKEGERQHSSSIEELECSFSARMSYCAEKLGSVSALAKKAGISQSGIRRYFTGGEPSRPHLVAIAAAAGVSVQWLATGEGSMMRKNLSEEKVAEPEVGRIKEDARMMHYAGSETTLSKADTILEAHRARKDKAEKQYWQQSLPASFYARLVPALSKHATDTKTIERMLERVISMVMALTVDLDTWPENIPDEHLDQLVAIAAAAIQRHDENGESDWMF